jgi:two-component system phosphate regulon sensor histidine kinase PhoR
MYLLAFIAIFLSTIQILGVCYDLFQTQMQRQIENEASHISAGLNHTTDRDAFLASLSFSHLSTRITVIDPDGTVYYDNQANPSQMENHINRPEVAEAIVSGQSQSVRTSATLGKRTFYIAKLLENGQIVRVAITTQSIYLMFLSILPAILIIVLVVAILVLFFSSGITKKIVAPLNAIDLDHPAQSVPYDELAPFLHHILQQQRQITHQMEVLRSQKGEFTTITQNMKEGLVVLDANLNVLSLNNSAAAIFPGPALHKEGENFLTLTRNLELYHLVKSTLSDRVGHNTVIELSGRSYQFFISPILCRDEEKSVGGAIIIILDVTEKQEAEKIRREFSANVSHELKTPLTSILGYAELLEREMVQEKDVPAFAQKIRSEASRLLSLIEDIIKLSRLDETSFQADFTQVNLLEVARSVIERLTPLARQRQVEFSLEGAPLFVQGHLSMLDELVYNLCDNAIRYNKEKGQVHITLKQSPKGPELLVEDTGIGIPLAHQNRIFERFYRVDKSHSKQTGGTGLGLSIVKHIVKLHHGTITLKSVAGEGTSISVTFPKEA